VRTMWWITRTDGSIVNLDALNTLENI
jgi:hypothetical protein